MKKFLAALILIAILGSGLIYTERVRLLEFVRNLRKELVPVATSFEDVNKSATVMGGRSPAVTIKIAVPTNTGKLEPAVSGTSAFPENFNLAVPFTPQAPHANWEQPYQDACEEASVAMVHYFYSKKSFTPKIADREILDLVVFEERTLGFDRDTTAEQTAEFTKNYYGYKTVKVVLNPTVEMIKDQIRNGYPVILPVYGQALRNPYFTPPGPTYHMLVVKGYTKDKFITNDPGTRRGADYFYSYETVMNAIHDFNNGDVQNGRKVMIVIYPN